MLRNDVCVDAVHLENRPAGRTDGPDDHPLVQGPHQILREAQAFRDLDEMAKLDLAGHRQCIELPGDDAPDESLEPGGIRRELPPVEPALVQDRLARHPCFGERLAPLPVVKQQNTTARDF